MTQVIKGLDLTKKKSKAPRNSNFNPKIKF